MLSKVAEQTNSRQKTSSRAMEISSVNTKWGCIVTQEAAETCSCFGLVEDVHTAWAIYSQLHLPVISHLPNCHSLITMGLENMMRWNEMTIWIACKLDLSEKSCTMSASLSHPDSIQPRSECSRQPRASSVSCLALCAPQHNAGYCCSVSWPTSGCFKIYWSTE